MGNSNMHLTTIIVTYNGFQWLDKCLGSLRSSSLPTQVIVIDNASQDGTPAYIQAHYPEVDLICSDKNLGFGQANNLGIQKALAQGAAYCFLLNQDAWVAEDTLAILIEKATTAPEYGILSPIHLNGSGELLDAAFYEYITHKNKYGREVYSHLALNRDRSLIQPTDFINAAAWLMSRACLERVGGFSPLFFHYGEDRDYAQRLHYHGLCIGFCWQAHIYHDREARDPAFNPAKQARYAETHLRNLLADIRQPKPFKSFWMAGLRFVLEALSKKEWKLAAQLLGQLWASYREWPKIKKHRKMATVLKAKWALPQT